LPEQGTPGSEVAGAALARGIASPLTLLHEEQSAKEVLSLSYTLNLGFWERHALSVARGLGARVTVVADAAMATADVGYVHYAGITYLDARAACKAGGAFHPKLLVIAGEDYATVAIGSGNVTLPGWHGNAEIWTVLRGDQEGAPTTFTQLAYLVAGASEPSRFQRRTDRTEGCALARRGQTRSSSRDPVRSGNRVFTRAADH
jgi:hypothetical protein